MSVIQGLLVHGVIPGWPGPGVIPGCLDHGVIQGRLGQEVIGYYSWSFRTWGQGAIQGLVGHGFIR